MQKMVSENTMTLLNRNIFVSFILFTPVNFRLQMFNSYQKPFADMRLTNQNPRDLPIEN